MTSRYPDYCWLDTAFGGPERRNNVREVREVMSALPDDPTNCYATWHRFPDAYREHLTATGTVSGYEGASYADFVPFDFDGMDLTKVLEQVRDFLKALELTYEIDGLRGVRAFFSGAKGFHICLSSALFGGWEPSVELSGHLRQLARSLSEGFEVDLAIYDQNRLLRLPNTIHGKSRLWKVPLHVAEVQNADIAAIQELARGPRDLALTDWDDVVESPACKALWDHLRQGKATAAPDRGTGRLFITGMRDGDGRDNQAFMIARHLRNHGLEEDVAAQILSVWDRAQIDPLGDTITIQKVRSAYSRASRATNGSITQADVLTPQELAHDYGDYITKLRSSRITLGLGPIDARLRGVGPGEVCTIMAKAGVGKTALLQNILRHAAAEHNAVSVFCSLEQPVAQVFERYAQILIGCTGEGIETSWTTEGDAITAAVRDGLGPCTLTCGLNLNIDQLGLVIEAGSTKAGAPVTVLAVDYLGMLDAGNRSRDLYGQMSVAARELKSVAKAHDLAVICICQVSRAAGDNGSQPLTIHSARESGAIEEAADFLLGVYRPNLGGEDSRLMIQILKNRKGQANVEFPFHFDKRSLRISVDASR